MGGVFHPAYRITRQKTATLLGTDRIGIFKRGGGEAERNPAKPCELFLKEDCTNSTELWPATEHSEVLPAVDFPGGSTQLITALWRGDWVDPYAIGVVIGTTAITLRISGYVANPASAKAKAHELWENREVDRFKKRPLLD